MTTTTAPADAPYPIPGVKSRFKKLHFYGLAINQSRNLIAMIEHRYQTYGNLSSRYFELEPGDVGHLMLFGPEYNQFVLSDSTLFHNFGVDFDEMAARVFGSGLLFQNGETHRAHRRLMMPAFHKHTIQTYRDTMVGVIGDYLDTWQPGQQRDLNHDMHQLAMYIATQTLFGIDVRDRSESIGTLIVDLMAATTNPLVYLLPINRPGFPRYKAARVIERLTDTLRTMIAEKRQQLANGAESHDALAMLIQARDEDGSSLTDDELVGQANILFVAGHETSANALTYILLLLSQHPRVMADLLDELTAVSDGAPPTVEQFRDMPLLDAVVKEGLRLFPPASLMNRVAIEGFSLGGYDFPQYTSVSVSQYITHRMPELFPEPRRFLPERWGSIQPTAYEYFPFGAGPRMCIGAGFATLEIKLVLAMLLQRYRLAVTPNTQVNHKLTFTLGVDGALPVIVHMQDRRFDDSRAAFGGNVRGMVDWV